MSKKIIVIIEMVLILTAISCLLFISHLEVRLIGDEFIKLEYKESYVEKGAEIYSCNLIKCNYVTSNIQISKVDIGDIGDYKVDYFYKDSYLKTRYISVVDSKKPNISINGNEIVYLPLDGLYVERGVKIVDNYDGDISDKVVIDGTVNTSRIGMYNIKYSIKDSSNNIATAMRKVVVYGKDKKDIKTIDNDKIKETINEIENYIKNNHLSISVLYNDILSGYTFTYNPKIIYYGCSLIKTLDAMYVYENMELNDKLRSNVKKAIEVSDNDAHYYLVNTIGKTNLINYGKSLGAKDVLTISGIYGNTTVYDQQVYMMHLFELLNFSPYADELKKYFLSDFKKYMKFDGAPDIVHKYGRISGRYFHESAVILDENPYILTILTKEDDRKYIITELSKKIYKLHLLLNEKEAN